MLFKRSRLSPLPDDFLFGVATADHQCEAYDPACEDIRDVWERQRNQTRRGRATDFWTRFGEDVELARQLGCRLFRFSIAWSRVEPRPGEFDEAAFAHYQEVVDAIHAAGMEPVLTLHHFTWPLHVEARGGLLAADFPATFAHYAAEVARRLGPRVPYWITFNEPNALPFGYIKPWWAPAYACPPGLPPETDPIKQMNGVGRLIRNLFLAHQQARAIIKHANPAALVGTNPCLLGFPGYIQWLIDRNATLVRDPETFLAQGTRFAESRLPLIGQAVALTCNRRHAPLVRAGRRALHLALRWRSILSTLLAANWWHLGMAGRLPTFLCPADCVGQQDFVGLDYYWGFHDLRFAQLHRLFDAIVRGHFNEAPVWPDGLYHQLRRHAQIFPNLPILIIENGSVDAADNIDRPTYLRRHIRQVQRAVHDGINVAGYICWSITSNREWGLPFGAGSNFGLYHIDLDHDPDLRRVETPAAREYAQIIRRRSV